MNITRSRWKRSAGTTSRLADLLTALMIASLGLAPESYGSEKAIVSCDNANLHLAPYVWKRRGAGLDARAEATMPGAYLKLTFRGSKVVELMVDGKANRGCPAPSMPVVEFSVDEGPFQVVPLTGTDEVYALPMAHGLDSNAVHRVDVCFRAADLGQDRWGSSRAHLRIAGLALDAGASVLPSAAPPKKAIAYGDSITEGVGVDGLFTSWQKLDVNNARGTWFPIVATALDCEYGQLGSGGLGMTRALNVPPLPQIWDHYDAASSRLTQGKLLPEPDYIFCALGTNDYEKDITADYVRWLTDMRAACPHSRFFCVVPPLGVHKAEVEAAVKARNKANDARVYVIDTSRLASAFRAGQGATRLAYDGVHPSLYGNALLGAVITGEVRAILDRDGD